MLKQNEILRSYGTEYREMTRRLADACGLAEDILEKAGGKLSGEFLIGIKPNLVTPHPADFGGTTHPELAAGILDSLLSGGIPASRIVILEGSWVGDRTEEAFAYCGYEALAAQYGVRLIDLQKDSAARVDCAGMELSICTSALQLKYLINVPVLKGHCQTKMTCALKNMKGVIPNSEKRRFHRMGLHSPIAHLNAGIRPDFIVIDHICGDPDFEEGGSPLVRNCVMAARDPVLTDAYGCEVLGYRPEEVAYIGIAEELGIGSADTAGLSLRTLEGERTAGEPADRLPGTDPAAGAFAGGLPETRKLVEIANAVEEIDSCSACFGTLIPALEKLKELGQYEALLQKLSGDRIGIGQGQRGRGGRIGVGNCTAGFDFCVRGCPPAREEIVSALAAWLRDEKRS